jgi:hypothetical protein
MSKRYATSKHRPTDEVVMVGWDAALGSYYCRFYRGGKPEPVWVIGERPGELPSVSDLTSRAWRFVELDTELLVALARDRERESGLPPALEDLEVA